MPWRILKAAEMPNATTLLNGRVDVGPAGIRAVGILWLFLAAAFLAVGAGALTDRESWPTMAAAVAGSSLVLSLLELPAARIGIAVNLVILAALLAVVRLGWT